MFRRKRFRYDVGMNFSSRHPIVSGDHPHRIRELAVRLEKSSLFRDYRAAFQTATGLPLVLRPAGSFRPPLAGSKQINPFCALMAARNRDYAFLSKINTKILCWPDIWDRSVSSKLA